MNRKAVLQGAGSAALLLFIPRIAGSAAPDWARLQRQVGSRLLRLHSPLTECQRAFTGSACSDLAANIRNPYYVGDHPELTQTLGWVDAWNSTTSPHAVAATSSADIAAAVDFARRYELRLAVKGGGHSYQGTSNAPDSLLIWTRHLDDIAVHGDSVTLGSGNTWGRAYQAVTTQAGRYVQGGGCTTVGVAGLVQSGGFGSFSKRYGTAAASLLSAEVVTADGSIRHVDDANNADLLWALKGGGGGTFGVVSELTLRLHDLPEFFGAAVAKIRARSPESYRRLLRRFVDFYRAGLFNEQWGETVSFGPDNILSITLVSSGLTDSAIKALWKPFFDWIDSAKGDYTLDSPPVLVALPARRWWDGSFWRANAPTAVSFDPRPGKGNEWWWTGDGGQVGWYLYGFESLWLPESLLAASDSQESLTTALFAASRHYSYALHFNKGLAGAPADAKAALANTATNPAVLTAFALAICADAQGPAYPGVHGHEPDVTAGRASAKAIHACVDELRAVAPSGGSYVSESNYFESDWQQSYWGSNYSRLLSIKKKYDPAGLFSVHHGVGSS